MLLTIEEIKERLTDKNIAVVSERTGVHRNTLSAIRCGENTNPTYNVIKILSEYLTC